ncbi:MAG: hypothetical protein L3J91_01490, partial [Thermoplasmata archaeon]|nr:hypothetical protein [Thermoplasmata archaeon]
MVPQPLPLELIVLFLAAGALAVAGVLTLLLYGPPDRASGPVAGRFRWRPIYRELLGPPSAVTAAAALVLAAADRLLPVR